MTRLTSLIKMGGAVFYIKDVRNLAADQNGIYTVLLNGGKTVPLTKEEYGVLRKALTAEAKRIYKGDRESRFT